MEQKSPPKPCCAPRREGPRTTTPVDVTAPTDPAQFRANAITIKGGSGLVGTRTPGIQDDGETPLRNTKIKPFHIGANTVTNAQFKAFIDATGYVTEAERFGWSFVFWAQVPDHIGATRAVIDVEWWRHVDGANWRDINGPDTAAQAWHPDHPVVQISWNDARKYCHWVGGRLPTEAEWEHAARDGLDDVMFPWGNALPNHTDQMPCNIWQGNFPEQNTGLDGYITTAPAQAYAPNGYGLYNVVGNVWEWTADAYAIKSLKKDVRSRLAQMKGYKVSKGGSFLCHASYCFRYRIAARSGTSHDSTTTHQGFRVVWPD